MYQHRAIEESIMQHVFKLNDKFRNDQLTFKEYCRLYDKVFEWVENFQKQNHSF